MRYCISPAYPASSQRSKNASSGLSCAGATPTRSKPTANAWALIRCVSSCGASCLGVRGGISTPRIKLQTFFFGAGLSRIRIDPKDDIDLILSHFHPFDQGTNHLTFAEPVGL